MPSPSKAIRLDVAGVVAHGALSAVTMLYTASTNAVIDGVVIVSDLETIKKVPPNTIVVLSTHVGSGGWQVSAALRHAWERRASAVIIAQSTYAESVISLAERLDINLMAAEQDPSIIALALAAEIGAVKSVAEVNLAQFAKAVTKETTVTTILKTISIRLGGFRLTLEHDGIVLAAAGPAADGGPTIQLDLPSVANWGQLKLTASGPKTTELNALDVITYLEVALPSIQSVWMAGEINDSAASAPTLALIDVSDSLEVDAQLANQAHPNLLAKLGWNSAHSYQAVWIAHPAHQQHSMGRTAILRLLWRKVATRRPLAEVRGGWLSLIPVEESEDPRQLRARIGEKVGSSLAELGFSVGTSMRQSGVDNLPVLARQARVAADYGLRMAPGAVTSFEDLGMGAVTAYMDDAAIFLVAGLTLPALMAAPDRDQIIRDTLAFLEHQSSMTLAAKALNIHRNTLQQRINRIRDVGIILDEPEQILPLHLILTVLKRTLQGSSTEQKDPHNGTIHLA